jgi:deoxyribose-phosphate aldolase
VGAGCVELDVVMNVGWAKSGRWDEVAADIAAVVAVAHGAGARVKVILENAYLTTEEKARGPRVWEGGGGGVVWCHDVASRRWRRARRWRRRAATG